MSSNSSQPAARQSSRSVGTMDKNDVEKRKASASALGADNSLNLSSGIPSKRPRVEFTPSRSPAMSPLFEDESPTKFFPPPKDKIEATMDLAHVPLLEEDDENSELNNKSTRRNEENERANEGNEQAHFVLPSPLNTAEEPEAGKGKDDQEDNGAESDSDSDKFFANVKAREEAQLNEEQEAAATLVNKIGKQPHSEITSMDLNAPPIDRGVPVPTKKSESPFYRIGNDGKIKILDSKTTNTSLSSTLDSEYRLPPSSSQVELDLKVYCSSTGKLLYDTISRGSRLRSDYTTVASFLKQAGVDLDLSASGYSADISSSGLDSHSSLELVRRKQLSMMSTISSIPRPSDASTVSRPSFASAKDASTYVKAPTEPRQGIHRGKMAPLLNSTRIEDQETQTMGNVNERTTKSSPLLNDNVLDINSNNNTGQKGTEIVPNGDSEEKLFATPKSNKPGRKGADKTPQTTVDSTLSSETSDSDLGKAQTPKGKWKANNTSSSTSTSTSSTSAQSSSRRKAKDQSDSDDTQPLTEAAKKAIAEFNDDSFAKSANLWGNISRGEIVFARWRDRKYYSGVISDKGANDTWKIKFDDNMDDVASETHIVPIKLLGYGVRAEYCPRDIYKPTKVFLVGLRKNPEANSKTTGIKSEDIHAHIEYATVNEDGEVVHCYRNNLTLRENDAKELRKEFCAPSTLKIGEIGIENIVQDTRRRRGGESLAPSDKIRRIIKLEQSGFDTSASDDIMRDVSALSTPTGPTPKKATGKSILKSGGAEKKHIHTPRRVSNTSGDSDTPSTKSLLTLATPTTSKASTTSTNTPKTTPAVATPKETQTPKTGGKAASASKPKKMKEKKLFEGIQFFMTASGGAAGDPSGCAPVVLPYDKDECRDLIENGGGRIVDIVGNESKGPKYPTYLISDSFARTVKYIYCVAAGVPCVEYKWVMECTRQNSLVDWKPFQLDAGWSLEENRIIPTHKSTPLKGLKVYITAESADLYNYWKPVLTAAQASLLKSYAKGPLIPTQTEVLVTDSTCPANVIAHAVKRNLPVVKPEWLVQTIIRGKKSAYDGHERYKLEQSTEEADQE